MSRLILGLSGEAGSGKDTVAEHLVKNHGFYQVAFADNLKRMCMQVFNLSHDHCYDQKYKMKKLAKPVRILPKHIRGIIEYAEKNNGYAIDEETECNLYKFVPIRQYFLTPREVLQFVGTEILRETIDENYHVNAVFNFLDKIKNEKIVITDARFPNERFHVKERKGVVVLVDRPTVKNQEVGLVGHASENSLGDKSEYGYVIDNSGTLSDLYNAVDSFVSEVV